MELWKYFWDARHLVYQRWKEKSRFRGFFTGAENKITLLQSQFIGQDYEGCIENRK